MKTILVPVEFSGSINIHVSLDYAISIAKKTKAKIILYNSITTPVFASNISFEVIEIGDEEKKGIANLNLLKDEIQKSQPDLIIESYPTSALRPISDEIVDAAVEKNADIIVMSTKGTNKLADIFISSNTIDVIMKSYIPVLAIPEQCSFNQIKNIAFATNFHYSDIDAIKQVTDIANIFDAHVTVIHFQHEELSYESEYNMLSAFRAQVTENNRYPMLAFKLFKDGDINKALNNFIHESTTDILALSTHKRGVLTRLFGSSITKKLAYHTTIPILVFRINKEE